MTEIVGLKRSMFSKGCTLDNSACEGFFGRVKKKIYARSWENRNTEEFSDFIDAYLHWDYVLSD